MKKLILSCLLVAAAGLAQAQVMVNGVNINDLGIHYVEIYGATGLNSVRINFGQSNTKVWLNFDPLTDSEGEPFRNTIAALNYLHKNGWELVLPASQWGDDEVYAYLLRRREE
jgi:3-dehydroquinate dehydratase